MIQRLSFLLIIALSACGLKSSTSKKEESNDNVIRQKWPNGNIKMEIPMKDDQKHGVARTYYENGTLRQQIPYENGLKQGTSYYYFENGKPYRVSSYVDNKLEGARTIYRENGKVLAEIRYSNSEPCLGTREYLISGEVKNKYPRLIIREIDEILTKELLSLEITISKKVRKPRFFRGVLDKNGCFDENLAIEIVPQEKDKLKLYFELPKGTFVMEEVHVFVRYFTSLGNPRYMVTSYNLAAENR